MQKLMTILVSATLFLFSAPLFAETGDVEIDSSKVDPSKVSFSDARISLQGPMELYISGVEYKGKSYAAILDYNGGTKLSVKKPEAVSVKERPVSLDLEDAAFSLTKEGVRIEGLSIDDAVYKGTFQYDEKTGTFRLSSYSRSSEGGDSKAEESKIDATLEKVIREQEKRIQELEKKLAEKDETIIDLNSKLRKTEEKRKEPFEEIRRRLSTPVRTGFDTDSSLIYGEWSEENGSLIQTDSDNFYAKYSFSLLQSEREYLYAFRGASKGKGWVGYGIHFLGSDIRTASKYQFGRSYLVWVTRDYRHNFTEKTYVELYRSNEDGDMIRLVSKAVEEKAKDFPKVYAHTDTKERNISVYIKGKEVFSYNDKSMFREGDIIALRTLKEAEFSEFTVYRK